MGGLILIILIIFGISFSDQNKLDYELRRIVKEDKTALRSKIITYSYQGKKVTITEVKVLTKDGKVKVVNLSERVLEDLIKDPNIVYIEAPRKVQPKVDILRNESWGFYGSGQSNINISGHSDFFWIYINPATSSLSYDPNICPVEENFFNSKLLFCDGSSGDLSLDVNGSEYRIITVGVPRGNISTSNITEEYLLGTNASNYQATGRGVIIGIVDSGINACHPAFFDSQGNTRVKFLGFVIDKDICSWSNGNYVQDIGVCEFDENFIQQAIQSGDCNFDDASGHGTLVAGISAGSDLSIFGRGVAPETDLVVCALLEYTDTELIKCLEWIKSKSESLNKPAVVNLSLGTHMDPHDGTGLLDRKIDELSGSGFIVVVAQSNEGDRPIHAYTTKTEDTIPVLVKGEAFIVGWYKNTSSGSKWKVRVCEPGSLYCVFTRTGSDTDGTLILDNGICDVAINMSMERDPINGDGRFEILISCREIFSAGTYKLELRLEQECGDVARVDMWEVTGNGVFLSNYEQDPLGGYKFTVASPGTAKRAITVGAINSRADDVFDMDNGTDTFQNLGKVANFSSRGPTRDGRIKPNVVAGGVFVIGPDGTYDPSVDQNPSYILSAGTSLSAPAVTGLVALFLENNPYATPGDVKLWLTSNALRDLSVNYPDVAYGYGKAVYYPQTSYGGSREDPVVSISVGEGIWVCKESSSRIDMEPPAKQPSDGESVIVDGAGGGGCSFYGYKNIGFIISIISAVAIMRRLMRLT